MSSGLSALNLDGEDEDLEEAMKDDSSETSSLNRQLPGERRENSNALWEKSMASLSHSDIVVFQMLFRYFCKTKSFIVKLLINCLYLTVI